MSCVSSVSLPGPPYLPRRKPACSRGRCGFTTGSMRLCINLSRILNGTQSSEMGLYHLGSCVGSFGFESQRASTVARTSSGAVWSGLVRSRSAMRRSHLAPPEQWRPLLVLSASFSTFLELHNIFQNTSCSNSWLPKFN